MRSALYEAMILVSLLSWLIFMCSIALSIMTFGDKREVLYAPTNIGVVMV